MVATNKADVITMSVQGQVASPNYPSVPAIPHQIDRDGKPRLIPTIGGIVYNVKLGDSVYGWVADLIEPGVAIKTGDAPTNMALNIFACVGNEAVVMSGSAKGAKGVVTGKSGRFAEHVILHFDADVLENLTFGDKILVRARGVGLALDNFPGIHLKSLSPELFEAMGTAEQSGKLHVPVTAIVPPELMGAGSGLLSDGWAICIQSMDQGALVSNGLDKLRLGDIVGIRDFDSAYSHGYRKGGISVGVVSSTDSIRAGYGPAVTLLMASPAGDIELVPQESVNIVDLLGISLAGQPA